MSQDVEGVAERFGRIRLLRNMSSLTFMQVAASLLPLITIPHLAQALGSQLFGVVSFGLALTQVAAILLDFGFHLSTTQAVALQRENLAAVNRITSSVLVCKIPLVLILPATISILLSLDSDLDGFGPYFYLLLPGMLAGAIQPTWLFEGLECMGYLTISVLVARLGYVVGILALVTTPSDYLWVAVLTSSSALLGTAVSLVLAARVGFRFHWPSRLECWTVFRGATPFFTSRVSHGTYTAGTVLFFGAVAGPVALASYSIADQIYRALQTLFSPIVQALYPYVVRTRDLKLLRAVMTASVVLCALGVVLVSLFGGRVLDTLIGPEYEDTHRILIILMFALCAVVPSALLGYPLLGALRKTNWANLTVVFGAIMQIALLGILFTLGTVTAVGVAVSVFLTESFVLTARLMLAKRALTDMR